MPTARMTFSVPPALKRRAQRRNDVNWSGVVQHAIERRLELLELADKLSAESTLSEADVKLMAEKVDARMAAHFGRMRRQE